MSIWLCRAFLNKYINMMTMMMKVKLIFRGAWSRLIAWPDWPRLENDTGTGAWPHYRPAKYTLSPSPTRSRTVCCMLSPSPPHYRACCPHESQPVTAVFILCIFTGRLPWQSAGIKFTQCVSGQKSAFSPLQEKLCVGSKNYSHLLELSGRSLSVCKVSGRSNYARRL